MPMQIILTQDVEGLGKLRPGGGTAGEGALAAVGGDEGGCGRSLLLAQLDLDHLPLLTRRLRSTLAPSIPSYPRLWSLATSAERPVRGRRRPIRNGKRRGRAA